MGGDAHDVVEGDDFSIRAVANASPSGTAAVVSGLRAGIHVEEDELLENSAKKKRPWQA